METSMQDPVEKPPRNGEHVYWDIKLLAVPLLLGTALIGFVISHPGASKWISDAAQAEFVGTDFVPNLVPATRLAEPKNPVRTVKAN
jgi:hypothetical protein